jgi:WD40 repeat protein
MVRAGFSPAIRRASLSTLLVSTLALSLVPQTRAQASPLNSDSFGLFCKSNAENAPFADQTTIFPSPDSLSAAQFVTLSSGEEVIVSTGNAVRFWRLANENFVTELAHSRDPIIEGDEDRAEYYRSALSVSPDGKQIALGGYSGFFQRSLPSGSFLFGTGSIIEGITNLKFSPDGNSILMSGYGDISIWNPHTGTVIHSFFKDAAYYYADMDVSGRYLVTSSEDAAIALWDLTSRKIEKYYRLNDNSSSTGSQKGFDLLQFSPDGSKILAADLKHQFIYVWKTNNPHEQVSLDLVRFDRYTITDNYLIVAYGNGSIELRSTETGNTNQIIIVPPDEVNSLSLSRDGSLLLVTGNNSIKLIDLSHLSLLGILMISHDHAVVKTSTGALCRYGK